MKRLIVISALIGAVSASYMLFTWRFSLFTRPVEDIVQISIVIHRTAGYGDGGSFTISDEKEIEQLFGALSRIRCVRERSQLLTGAGDSGIEIQYTNGDTDLLGFTENPQTIFRHAGIPDTFIRGKTSNLLERV